MIRLRVELLGGPYDGARGLYLTAQDEDDETPYEILVGMCRGQGLCGMSACTGNRGSHVAFWIPDEEEDEPPVGTLRYVKADEERSSSSRGDVRYVCGELGLPGALEEREVAGAGAFGGLTYGN